MPETKEIIKKQFKKLPQDIKDAILAADLPDKFKTIANKHKLRIDQSGILENETMFVMLGIEHPDDYTNNLKKEAGMSDEDAEKIAEEVSRTIFLPIRASLQKLHEAEKEESQGIEHPSLTPNTKEKTLQTTPELDSDNTEKKDIFREKLEKQIKSAKEEVHLNKPLDKTQNETQTTVSQQTKTDPYREPIEKKDTEGIKQEGIGLTTNNENTPQIKSPETAITPPQTKTEIKKPVSTSIPTTAEKLNAEVPPRIIPKSSVSPSSAPSLEKPAPQPTEQKKEVPLPKTGIINMPSNKIENVVPQTDQPLAEKKVDVPQKPSAEIEKTPTFTALSTSAPLTEKSSANQQPASSQTQNTIMQKLENVENGTPKDTLNILEKTKAPTEKTAMKPLQTASVSSPPTNLPQKEISTQTHTSESSVNLGKKDSASDPYREPIE